MDPTKHHTICLIEEYASKDRMLDWDIPPRDLINKDKKIK
jgi:hypothetical protein